jgi:hypothetical protein
VAGEPHPPVVSRAPIGLILKVAGVVAAAAGLLGVVCYGLAWVWRGATLQLLQVSYGSVLVAGAALGLAGVLIAGWSLLHMMEVGLAARAMEREARLAVKRAERERAEAEKAREEAARARVKGFAERRPAAGVAEVRAAYGMAEPGGGSTGYLAAGQMRGYGGGGLADSRVRRGRPGTATIVFSVLGIIFGGVASFVGLIPFFGIIAISFGLGFAIVCTAIALVLCHYERSERFLPLMALGMVMLTVFAIMAQYVLFGSLVFAAKASADRAAEEMRQKASQTRSQAAGSPFFHATPDSKAPS